MRILFTKNFNKMMISKKLGSHFSYDFVEVIKIVPMQVEPFDLKNKSLIFTSVNAVKSFFENGFRPDENFTSRNFNKIYTVGMTTKKELRKYGFGTFKVTRHAKELSEFIIENSSKENFLHFCGNLALDVLNKTLPLQNISYRKIPVYETVLLYPKVTGTYDAVCFFSPSGVRSFAKFNSLNNIKIYSIGETTEKEIKKFTKNPIITSKESTMEDLLRLIARPE
ncbi:uroporphyrinogen-III synthase [Kaistella pullorum]|uniref:Uroporphyrinogen-III synthase n=1 Tax=Kaistella pullorum TaxID=2763074 RepID=A0ABR8WJK6_9FLAO|nr:uroporphyrinogen-III synthase [Kaistella pullorum]MBD8017252.1 uroporphyrinogen-III synthase [Kaistella pullorum]